MRLKSQLLAGSTQLVRQRTEGFQMKSKTARLQLLKDQKLCLACNSMYEDPGQSHCTRDGTQLVNLGRDESLAWCGEVLKNKYEITARIGKGAQGTVFEAVSLDTGTRVAVKMLKSIVSNVEFDAKMAAIAGLSHPNLVQIHDWGMTDENQPYLVRELLHGVALNDLIKKRGNLNPIECHDIFLKAMDALTAAHENGVFHGDLKPSNLVLTEESLVKLLDLNLQRFSIPTPPDWDGPFDIERYAPCPTYLSPEQCEGKKVEASSDVYSLAVVIYEALTGTVPFKGRNLVETMRMKLSLPPAAFYDRRPDLRLSNKLQEVLFRALEREPAKRFQSMAEFSTSFSQAIVGADANEGLLREGEQPQVETTINTTALTTPTDSGRAADSKLAPRAGTAPGSERPTLYGIAVLILILVLSILSTWK